MISSAAILNGIIDPEADDLSPEAAESILRFAFREADHAQLAALSAKAKAGTISSEEQADLNEYLRVADLLAILQSKARRSLKRARRAS